MQMLVCLPKYKQIQCSQTLQTMIAVAVDHYCQAKQNVIYQATGFTFTIDVAFFVVVVL